MAEKNTRLAKYLRALRESHENTQDELAEMLGVTRQTYSHYENCRLMPSTEALYRIAVFYHVPIEKMILIAVSDTAEIQKAESSQLIEEDSDTYAKGGRKSGISIRWTEARAIAYDEFINSISSIKRKLQDLSLEEIDFYYSHLEADDQETIRALMQKLYIVSNKRVKKK
ncbi:MAG: helix-turn-helix domain-containing protein [Butyrivibrio sp.]|jgi:transcriptional regulator with XRE-family HTH domain|nr:helix-turn-helix domain-containing protein [Butyrivibrio sp.]